MADQRRNLARPHPRFAAHFTDPLYADEGQEFAPFGSDEGADLLAEAVERQDRLGPTSTVRDLLAEESDDVDELIAGLEADNQPDVDGFVIGAGFALILLTGQIDDEGRRWTLDAIARGVAFYGPQPEFTVLTRDLTSF